MKGTIATKEEVQQEMQARLSGSCTNSSIDSIHSDIPELSEISEIFKNNILEEFKKDE